MFQPRLSLEKFSSLKTKKKKLRGPEKKRMNIERRAGGQQGSQLMKYVLKLNIGLRKQDRIGEKTHQESKMILDGLDLAIGYVS